jgi:large subunit ribosomal protein L23
MALFGSKKNSAPAQKKTAKKTASKEAAVFTNPEGSLERLLGRPRITEKATMAIAQSAYVFEVPRDATKPQIKKAVQAIYKVTPRKINIVSVAPRSTVSRMRGRRGVSPGLKKAIVYLTSGERIELI